MSTPWSPAPEQKYHGLPSSLRPLGQAIFTFLCAKLHSLLQCVPTAILPVGVWDFHVTALCRVMGYCMYKLCSSQGMEDGPWVTVHCKVPRQRVVTWLGTAGNLWWPELRVPSWAHWQYCFPAPLLGNPTVSGTPLVLWLLGCWDHTDSPRILSISPPKPLLERCLPLESNSKGSNFALWCYITFW